MSATNPVNEEAGHLHIAHSPFIGVYHPIQHAGSGQDPSTTADRYVGLRCYHKTCRVKSDQTSNRIDNLTQITALRVRPKLQSHGSYFHAGDHSLSMT